MFLFKYVRLLSFFLNNLSDSEFIFFFVVVFFIVLLGDSRFGYICRFRVLERFYVIGDLLLFERFF